MAPLAIPGPVVGDADVVLVGGKVFTGSRERPWARALAVRGDRLMAVGSDAAVERWCGPRTRLIDLRGRVAVPGFIDAHAHVASAAGELGSVRLEGARSLREAIDRLREAARRTPPGAWVLGVGWDEGKWPEGRYLTREDLDLVSTAHPVVARRVDGHMGSLNSLALERARDSSHLRGFEVDEGGRPTGILKEDAFEAFRRAFQTDETQVESGLPRMAAKLHRLGITSVHDVVDRTGWRAYQRLHRRGRLGLRVYALFRDPLLPALADAGLMTGLGDERLRLGAIKVFADGSLGAYTAALSEPYAGRPGERGILVHPQRELADLLDRAHRAGFQTASHALGDAAIRCVVEALEAIPQAEGGRRMRHRIEHYELPDVDILRRTKAAGLIASCQPNFIGQWSGPGDVYETRLGPERAGRNNPYRRILRHGIPLCFGSDGMPYGPLYGIHWAVNGFHTDQRIPVTEAIRAYTFGGAYASFEEHIKGTLEPGKLADFVVLGGDPFEEPERIAGIPVASTWLGGVPVYQRAAKD